ncbi:MAG: hypothetical protein ACM30E_08545 [Nitrososphaerales archaeon]
MLHHITARAYSVPCQDVWQRAHQSARLEVCQEYHEHGGSGRTVAGTCALPASSIDRIETAPGDYEHEPSYHEAVGPNDPGPNHPSYSRCCRVGTSRGLLG